MSLTFNLENARVMMTVLYDPGYTLKISSSSFGTPQDDEEGFWIYFRNKKESIDVIVTYRGEGIYLEETPGYRSHAEDHPFQEDSPAITGDAQSLRNAFEKMKRLKPGSTPSNLLDIVRGEK